MNARDAGFALAALLIDPKNANALAERAPRGAGPAIQNILKSMQAPALRAHLEAVQTSAGAALEAVHPSWIAARLLEVGDEVLAPVYRSLTPALREGIGPELRRWGRTIPTVGRTSPLQASLDADIVQSFQSLAFPGLGPAAPPRSTTGVIGWITTASGVEIGNVSRECGLRVVARAFCRIGREDLAKLCHGLPAQDSVRLVSLVVELNEKLELADLKRTQGDHLLLLKATGISHALFDDTGLAFVAATAVASLDEEARIALAYRLHEEVGRRLLDLSAPGALPPDQALQVYRNELPEWLAELKEQGVARSFS